MGSSDEDINKKGRAQVEALSLRLQSFSIKAFYSSPLKRTITTAEILAHGKKISIRRELTEIDFGDWEGLTKEDIREKWPSLFEKMRQDPGPITPPNGESFSAMQERARRIFTEIAHAHPNETIAIITHDIIIKALVIFALQAPTSIYHHFQISPASLTILKFDGKIPLLTLLNSQTEKAHHEKS
jgi:broad specificity phosphatase PhoE